MVHIQNEMGLFVLDMCQMVPGKNQRVLKVYVIKQNLGVKVNLLSISCVTPPFFDKFSEVNSFLSAKLFTIKHI